MTEVEKVQERGTKAVPDRSISQIHQPTITVHRPPEKQANGLAVVICPGGGYSRVVVDKEGHDVARWLTTFGVAGIVFAELAPPGEVEE